MNERSGEPSSCGGVPTAMKMTRRALDGLDDVRREAQAAGLLVLVDQLFEARLVDRRDALLEQRDLRLVLVDARHVHAEVGEAGARHEADVARSDHADVHRGKASEGGIPGRAILPSEGRRDRRSGPEEDLQDARPRGLAQGANRVDARGNSDERRGRRRRCSFERSSSAGSKRPQRDPTTVTSFTTSGAASKRAGA